MTVSRMINGYQHIRPATATRVKAAIEQLSYSPNQAARMLMGQRSNSIGLVVPELRNPVLRDRRGRCAKGGAGTRRAGLGRRFRHRCDSRTERNWADAQLQS